MGTQWDLNPDEMQLDRFKVAYNLFMKAMNKRCLKEGGKQLVIDEQIELALRIFIAWASGHDQKLVELAPTFSSNKAILIRGNVGSGKSILFRTLKDLLYQDEAGKYFKKLTFATCESISKQFMLGGDKFIERYGAGAVKMVYGRPELSNVCFDDLGNEEAKNHYGNYREVMKDIISERYDHFLEHRLLSCFTTNLTMDEIEKRYDERIRSRLEQMCNIIGIGTTKAIYTDRRK